MNTQTERLIDWINTHDTGVTPAAVYDPVEEVIVIRSTGVTSAGELWEFVDRAHTHTAMLGISSAIEPVEAMEGRQAPWVAPMAYGGRGGAPRGLGEAVWVGG